MEKRHTRNWIMAVLLGLFWASAAGAANNSPLTEKELERWIATYVTIDAWGYQHEKTIQAHEDESAATDGMATAEEVIKPIKAAGLYDDANKLVKKEGFKSLEHWADITLKVVNASLAIAMEQHTGKADDKVPAGDLKLVKKYESQIRQVWEEAKKKEEAMEAKQTEAESTSPSE